MIVKMIQNLGNRIDKMQETFNKDVEELKRNQATMKNTINEIKNEIKNTLDGINSIITEAEERISDLEDKMVEITTTSLLNVSCILSILFPRFWIILTIIILNSFTNKDDPKSWKQNGENTRND